MKRMLMRTSSSISSRTNLVKLLFTGTNKKEYLGKGGFAQCFRFRDMNSGQDVAGKVIDKKTLYKSRTLKKLLYEISIHKSLDHPNIVKFLDFFEDSNNVYIILELCDDGNLNDFFKKYKTLSEKQVRGYIRQMISALKYLHDRNIIHRDLKLGNLLLMKGGETIKLGDFGLSSRLEYREQRRRTICGTPNYIAPEIIGAKTTHSFEVDVWSLGVIIYILLVGNPPFMSKNIKETYRKIRTCDFSVPSTLSEEARSLLKCMLEKDSSKRVTLNELNMHSFVTLNGKLEGPLHLNPEKEIENQIKNNEELENDETPFNDSLNSANQVNLSKKALHTQVPQPTTLNHNDLAFLESNIDIQKIQSVWVVKCADYSSKYGLGYLLSNAHIGVFFNDKTKILFSPKGNKFMYASFDEEGLESTKKYTVKKTPPMLEKKLKLCENFKDYLLDSYDNSDIEKGSFCEQFYVTKWLRSRNAFCFKFPNKVIQVLFNDNSEIRIIGKPSKIVLYVSKEGDLSYLSMKAACESADAIMAKRFNYAKKMVEEMFKK